MEEQENNKAQSTTVWYKNWKVLLCIFLIVCYFVGSRNGHKNYSSSSSSSNSGSHTCLNCGKSYSGYGYATIGGEEYALSKDQGNQYCSSSCARASRAGRFKNM